MKNGQARFDLNPTSPVTLDTMSVDEEPMQIDSVRRAPPQSSQNMPNMQGAVGGLQQQGNAAQSGAVQGEPPLFLCQPFVRTTLVKGLFKTIVQLPKYVDSNEWLALNVFEMLTNLNQFFLLVKDFIPPDLAMTAGPGVKYAYFDAQSGKSYNLPASQYIEYTLTNLNAKVNDQLIFPTKNGSAFPPTFLREVKSICTQMFRIFAYIYHNQFDKIIHLSLEPHWNSFFLHFVSFVLEFGLVEEQEMTPMLPLIISFQQQKHIITSHD